MRWHELPQAGDAPGARSSHAMACVGGKAYLIGGEHQPRVPLPPELFVYDLSSGVWTKPAVSGACPGPRVAANLVAAANGDLLLYGGRTGQDMAEGLVGSVVFRLATAQQPLAWEALEPAAGSPVPPPRSYAAMAAAGDRVFLFGGCGPSGRLADAWAFTTTTRTWRQLPSCEAISARGGPALVASRDGSALHVIGGFDGRAECADAWSLDLSSPGGAWSAWPALPFGRSVFCAAAHACPTGTSCGHAGHVLAFGGEVAPSDKGHAGAGDFCAELVCGDGSGWHVLQPGSGGPGPRGWLAAAAQPDGSLLVHGGLDGTNARRSDLWRLQCCA